MQKFEDSFDGKFDDCLRHMNKPIQATKQQRIVINVAQTQYAVVKHIAKKKKWQLLIEPTFHLNFDLCWIDSHLRPQFFTRMGQHQKINHMPGMSILSRKNNLGKNLMLFRKRFPLDFDFFPLTWSLPSQFAQLNQYHENRQQGKAQTFIVKPEANCQGRGIFLTRHIEKLKHEKYVVQRYMHKPYLIDGLKFDLRIYVLITGVDPLRIFIYQEGLARFATQPYKPPRSQNLQNKFMHLTNYAINKDHPDFLFNQSITQMNKGHKRSLTSIYEHLEQQKYDVKELKKKIDDIIIKTIITGYPNISRSFTSAHPDNFGNDMCFQILGFDIMLDYKLSPTLIEVNYTPSFTADTPLDRHIKKKLIDDTLALVNITQKWKLQMKKKREKQIQQRMVSGKRKKYSQEEKIFYMQQALKKRNEFENKILNKEQIQNGYRKIFLLSQEQLKQYEKYYQFAEEVYINSLTVSGGNGTLAGYFQQIQTLQPNTLYKNYFSHSANQTLKNKSTIVSFQSTKTNQMSSSLIPQNNNHSRIDNHSNYHRNEPTKSKRVSSAKPKTSKKKNTQKDISSSKFLYRNENGGEISLNRSKNLDEPDLQTIYMGNQSIFRNKGLKEALLSKTKKENINDYNDRDNASSEHGSNVAEIF